MSIDETELVYNENDDALWSTMPKVSTAPSVSADCQKLKRKQQKNPGDVKQVLFINDFVKISSHYMVNFFHD